MFRIAGIQERKLVVVTWKDTTTYTGWVNEEDIDMIPSIRPTLTQTSGWLITNNKSTVKISSCRNDLGNSTNTQVIPKETIIDIYEVPGG